MLNITHHLKANNIPYDLVKVVTPSTFNGGVSVTRKAHVTIEMMDELISKVEAKGIDYRRPTLVRELKKYRSML
jgi:hypothetical protein